MKKFKIEIPEGYEAKLENGQVVCYPIDKEECTFEVGDIVVCKSDCGNYDIIRLIHRVSKKGAKLKYWSSHEIVTDYSLHELRSGCDGFIVVSSHAKATPEQERLFKQKCLENGFWFDQIGKKWIELKEGGIYNVDGVIEIFDKFTTYNKSLNFKCTLKESGYLFELGYVTGYHNVHNISEATEEEKQLLFDALAKKGKQWNAEKKCVEDLKWKPEGDESYWVVGSAFDIYVLKNYCLSNDKDRIKFGNCFETKEEAGKYAEYMKQCSLNYKP